MPDQVWDISRIPGGWLNANTQIFKNYHEIKRTMTTSAGLGLNLFKGAFSASGSYERSQHTITNSSKFIEEVSSYSSAVRVDLHMPWALNISRNAKSFTDRLLSPHFNDNTASSYFRFIRFFGTHLFQSANFGGIIKLHMETSSDYYKGKSTRDVKAQAEASFLKILSLNGGYQGSNTRVDETFTRKTTQTIRYIIIIIVIIIIVIITIVIVIIIIIIIIIIINFVFNNTVNVSQIMGGISVKKGSPYALHIYIYI